VVAWTLIVEGGGDNDVLRSKCREGFRRLLAKAGFAGRMPRIVAGGGRGRAFELFRSVLAKRGQGELIVLLIDSEAARDARRTKWQHLAMENCGGWERPDLAEENDVFLMAQVMETWLVADPSTMAEYFGQGFHAASLPKRANLEEVPKSEIYAAIEKATAKTKTKGIYGKGAHSFDLLGRIDPAKLESLPHARDFFETMRRRVAVAEQ